MQLGAKLKALPVQPRRCGKTLVMETVRFLPLFAGGRRLVEAQGGTTYKVTDSIGLMLHLRPDAKACDVLNEGPNDGAVIQGELVGEDWLEVRGRFCVQTTSISCCFHFVYLILNCILQSEQTPSPW